MQCFEEARALIIGGSSSALPAPYAYCAGFFSLNTDHHLRSKFANKREKPLGLADRQDLVRIATADLSWLELSKCSRTIEDVARLRQLFPSLQIDHFEMNGADDMVKYKKWCWAGPSHKMITMGRPGSTPAVVQGMASVGIPAGGSADFVLGPELPDISSSKLRAASKRGDRAALLQLCHPQVADFMLVRDGHGHGVAHPPSGVPKAAAQGCCAQMVVGRGRGDGSHTTSLRKTATTSRDQKHMTGEEVKNGDEVVLLRQEEGFCWIRTATGEEGCLNTSYMSAAGGAAASAGGGAAASPSLMAIVRRTDGGDGTLLRSVATTGRSGDVWTDPTVQVRSGEEVEVLHQDAASGFVWVRTAAGLEGYLNASYFLGQA